MSDTSGYAPHNLHNPHNPDIESRLLHEAYAREPVNVATTGCVAIVGAVLLWPQVDTAILMGWLAALLAVTALGWLQYRRFKQVQASAYPVRRWQNIFAAKAVLAGAAWTLGPALLSWRGVGTLDALLVGVLLCVCAVGMTSVAPQKNAMQGFILAALVPAGLAALIAGGRVEQLVAVTLDRKSVV